MTRTARQDAESHLTITRPGNSARYEDALDYLNSLAFQGVRLGLQNTDQLLKRLGDPHKNYKVVHVAGTNGKGSTATMVSSILSKAGIKNGLFVSPHLETFRERIGAGGQMIGKDDSARLIEKVRKAAAKNHPLNVTYFEFVTAMAFLYFAMEKVKVAVVEVGMGGRFDSTNVVDPAVSIITSVAMDHQRHLGFSLAKIAREKCGIIKPGKPVVCGVRDKDVAQTIMDEADKKSAPVKFIGKDFTGRRLGMSYYAERFNFQSDAGSIKNVEVSLAGRRQIDNASCAILSIQLLRKTGFDIKDDAIRTGLIDVNCPGRFEVVKQYPLLILDGAHNRKAASSLSATLVERFGKGKMNIVFGAMKDKDYKRMIKSLCPAAKSFIFYSPDVPRAENPDDLASAQTDPSIPTGVIKNLDEVINLIETAPKDDLFCVTGSFYTVGEIRAALRRVKAEEAFA